MKIQPLGNIIQIEIEEAKAGVLKTDSRPSAVEYGKVLAVGEEVKIKVQKGDNVFVKAWAIDNITHEDKKYHFVSVETNGILAVVGK